MPAGLCGLCQPLSLGASIEWPSLVMSSTRVKSNIKVPRVSFHLDLTKVQEALKDRADQVIKSQINSNDSPWNFDRVEVLYLLVT